ncbi:hypothetical protein [Bacillus xiapuensis]|uniref:Phage protein n=1 Tax=Bacillus xiapuensis TaxID=2014075 RepID=A0ABU6NAE6_9BACI|nr:hypothetical protein [Bacillus xiapuensis]
MFKDYLGKYQTLLKANATDGIITSSKELVLDNFEQTLFVEDVIVDGVSQKAIVKQEKKSEDKKLIFKPDTKLNKGSVVEWEKLFYLVTDFLGEGINEIYPTATVKLCNSSYPIKQNKTRVLKTDAQGKPELNKFGDPVYIYTNGQIINIPCIVQSTFPLVDENKQLPLPQGSLTVTMQYREDIKTNDTFPMYNNTYKIRNIDYTKVINYKGIMTLSVEQVTSEVK